MKQLKRANLIKRKNRKGESYYYIRSYWSESETGDTICKETSTGIQSDRRNKRATKEQADRALDSFISRYGRGTEQIYIQDYCDRWLANQTGKEQSTLEGYSYRLDRIKKYFNDKGILLSELTRQDVHAFYSHLLTVKNGVGKARRVGYSSQTIHDTKVMLCMILKDAVRDGLVQENVAEDVKPGKQINRTIRESSKDIVMFEPQLQVFFEAVKGHPLEDLFLFTYLYGLRREEVIALKWESIHDGRIYIENTKTHTKTIIEKGRTKNSDSNRSYLINHDMEQILNRIKGRQRECKLRFGDSYVDSGYVFTRDNGEGYLPDYVTKTFKKIIRNTEGLDDRLTLHSLRKSCVSVGANNGISVRDMQQYVGHGDIRTTQKIYWKTDIEKSKLAVLESLESALSPSQCVNG